MDLDAISYTTGALNENDSATTSLESLLYQAGYLTIQKANPSGSIVLGIPNREVRSALSFQFLRKVAEEGTDRFRAGHLDACGALAKGDLTRAIKLFRSSIAALPFSWMIRDEGAAKVAFLSFFYPMPQVRIATEEEMQSGKIDAVVEAPSGVYIFEFKYNQTAQIAHDQVLEKGYADPYRACGKPVFAIGLNYSSEGDKRGMDEAVVSQIG